MTDAELRDALLAAARADARKTYAYFETIPTEQLQRQQQMHQFDLAHATAPEGIAFGGGRLALIAAVLRKRLGGAAQAPKSIVCPQCYARSFHPQDIAEKYCGACHQFHDQMEHVF